MPRDEHRKPLNPDRIVDPRSVPFAPPRYRGHLPHIYKEGCTYFVTFCLFDVVLPRVEHRKKLVAEANSTAIAERLDPALSGLCLLKSSALSKIVEDALLHFQGERYALSAWCVMPNHVHSVVTPYENHTLLKLIHSWKSFTAHEINKRLNRQGPVWQDESFDHLIRGPESFSKFVAYTELNPVAAKLVNQPELWPFSSARYRSQEDR